MPKPSATERTLYRFRLKHNIETKQDEERLSRLEELKQKIKEAFLLKRKEKEND